MGVDADLYLAPDVELENVLDVVVRLMRLPCDRDEYHFYETAGMRVEPQTHYLTSIWTYIPDGRFVGADLILKWHYHEIYKTGPERETKVWGQSDLRFSSSPLRIAIMRGIAKRFGGVLDPQDTTDDEEKREVFKRPGIIMADIDSGLDLWDNRDDETYHDFKRYLWETPALTKADIDSAREVCAYNRREDNEW